jgi:hypothetical protein
MSNFVTQTEHGQHFFLSMLCMRDAGTLFLRTLSMQQKIHYFLKSVQNEIHADIHYLNCNS